ncbi:hypothetical protein AAG906_039231 [Vitis piasezkii]
MVRLRRTRKVLRGSGPWPRLDTILNYKRDPSHSTNEHVDHVANMFKRYEEEYILESNRKMHILQMSLTEPEKKVLENIWESIQEGYFQGTMGNMLREECHQTNNVAFYFS